MVVVVTDKNNKDTIYNYVNSYQLNKNSIRINKILVKYNNVSRITVDAEVIYENGGSDLEWPI